MDIEKMSPEEFQMNLQFISTEELKKLFYHPQWMDFFSSILFENDLEKINFIIDEIENGSFKNFNTICKYLYKPGIPVSLIQKIISIIEKNFDEIFEENMDQQVKNKHLQNFYSGNFTHFPIDLIYRINKRIGFTHLSFIGKRISEVIKYYDIDFLAKVFPSDTMIYDDVDLTEKFFQIKKVSHRLNKDLFTFDLSLAGENTIKAMWFCNAYDAAPYIKLNQTSKNDSEQKAFAYLQNRKGESTKEIIRHFRHLKEEYFWQYATADEMEAENEILFSTSHFLSNQANKDCSDNFLKNKIAMGYSGVFKWIIQKSGKDILSCFSEYAPFFPKENIVNFINFIPKGNLAFPCLSQIPKEHVLKFIEDGNLEFLSPGLQKSVFEYLSLDEQKIYGNYFKEVEDLEFKDYSQAIFKTKILCEKNQTIDRELCFDCMSFEMHEKRVHFVSMIPTISGECLDCGKKFLVKNE